MEKDSYCKSVKYTGQNMYVIPYDGKVLITLIYKG